MIDLDLLILAAGYGTRLRPLTEDVPKAMLPIYGRPLLGLLLDRFLNASPDAGVRFRRITVNGHHHAGRIESFLCALGEPDRVHFSFEPEILGSGGALKKAAAYLESDPFVVVNGDALFDPPLLPALEAHRRGGFLATMVMARSAVLPNVRVARGRVTEIIERRADDAFTFTGFHMVSQALLDLLPASGFHAITETYRAQAAAARLGGLVWPPSGFAPFITIDTPESYLEAHRLCAGGGARGFGFPVLAVPDSVRPGFPEVIGYGHIDPAARIGAGAVIERSVILGGATVAPGSRIAHSVVGPDAVVDGTCVDRLVTRLGERPIQPEPS